MKRAFLQTKTNTYDQNQACCIRSLKSNAVWTKKGILIFVSLVFFSFAKSQEYCPGTAVSDTIYVDTISVYPSFCFSELSSTWNNLIVFKVDSVYSIYPSGLDVAIVINQMNESQGSIVNLNGMTPISQGDTLYVKKNDTYYNINLTYTDSVELSFMYIIMGSPTVYNQMHSCNYSVSNLVYAGGCGPNGYYLQGSYDTCYTCSQTAIEKSIESEIDIYPNPAKNKIEIEGLPTGQIELMDLNGRIIQIDNFFETKTSVDISRLSSGVYLIRIKTDKGLIMRKLIRE